MLQRELVRDLVRVYTDGAHLDPVGTRLVSLNVAAAKAPKHFVSVNELATLNCVGAVVELGDLLQPQFDYFPPSLRVAVS